MLHSLFKSPILTAAINYSVERLEYTLGQSRKDRNTIGGLRQWNTLTLKASPCVDFQRNSMAQLS